MKKLFALLLIAVLVLGLAACGGGDSEQEIVGRWVFEDDPSKVTTFNADGTGTHTISWGYGTTFEWSIRRSDIRWDYPGHMNMYFDFRISDGALYISRGNTLEDGTTFRHIRG